MVNALISNTVVALHAVELCSLLCCACSHCQPNNGEQVHSKTFRWNKDRAVDEAVAVRVDRLHRASHVQWSERLFACVFCMNVHSSCKKQVPIMFPGQMEKGQWKGPVGFVQRCEHLLT